MDLKLTAAGVFERYKDQLSLTWLAGRGGQDRLVRPRLQNARGSAMLGALISLMNLSNPSRIQVLGAADLRYLMQLGKAEFEQSLQHLFAQDPCIIIVADNEEAPEALLAGAENTNTPLLGSRVASYKLVNHLQYFLTNLLAEKITLHGVFMEVKSIGVLLTGDSGMGKSELAFELITRGHRLIADDAPEFYRIAPDTVNGVCPKTLDGFLEVRGLGVLNIRAMFGDNAIKQNKYLRLIINLKDIKRDHEWEIDRLYGSNRMRSVLEVDIPEITLPVAAGRNLAVLVEGAALNHILKLKGYDAARDFINTQQRLIRDGES